MKNRTNSPCHRQLLVISGDEDWGKQQALSVCSGLNLHQLCFNNWSGQTNYTTNKSYQQRLGCEYDAVVYNGHLGIRANALAALSGTIRKHGLMILLLPDLTQWQAIGDPQSRERISWGFDHPEQPQAFIGWLQHHFTTNRSVCILTPDNFQGENVLIQSSNDSSPSLALPLYTEQNQAVAAICKVATGRRKRPLVLTANRGRGKSSSLGMAAAQLLQQGKQRILLTGPSPNTVEQVFTHAQQRLPEYTLNGTSLTQGEQGLEYLPFDEILRLRPSTDLLMIDEAAAVPTQVLEQLSQHYNRLVFSTTIHGYEGSGRGFELRFLPYLKQVMPDLVHQHLKQPIRWFEGDCLEQFWFKSLLLDGVQKVAKNDADIPQKSEQTLSFVSLKASDLIQNAVLFRQAFELLVSAHYQTKPDDLSRLLDGPENTLHVLSRGKTLLGVCWTCEEGGTQLNQLQDEIVHGQRRVNGHLIPQNLAYYYLEPSLLQQRFVRIVRIAVTPEHQHQGLGSELLRYVRQTALKLSQIDFVATSFAASPQLMTFWHRNNFSLVRFGHKKDASSGEHSTQLLHPLNRQSEQQLNTLTELFYADWMYHLSGLYREVSPELVWNILSQQQHNTALDKREIALATQFSHGERPFEFCQQALLRLALKVVNKAQLTPQQQTLAVTALFQHRHEQSSLFKQGKKSWQQNMRNLVREWLNLL